MTISIWKPIWRIWCKGWQWGYDQLSRGDRSGLGRFFLQFCIESVELYHSLYSRCISHLMNSSQLLADSTVFPYFGADSSDEVHCFLSSDAYPWIYVSSTVTHRDNSFFVLRLNSVKLCWEVSSRLRLLFGVNKRGTGQFLMNASESEAVCGIQALFAYTVLLKPNIYRTSLA